MSTCIPFSLAACPICSSSRVRPFRPRSTTAFSNPEPSTGSGAPNNLIRTQAHLAKQPHRSPMPRASTNSTRHPAIHDYHKDAQPSGIHQMPHKDVQPISPFIHKHPLIMMPQRHPAKQSVCFRIMPQPRPFTCSGATHASLSCTPKSHAALDTHRPAAPVCCPCRDERAALPQPSQARSLRWGCAAGSAPPQRAAPLSAAAPAWHISGYSSRRRSRGSSIFRGSFSSAI